MYAFLFALFAIFSAFYANKNTRTKQISKKFQQDY